ncbi:inositol-trisphosphate 3-kinase homolog [Ischnura elegans]|uniref:inositol-trisphosphate 3-kinase homolog n=1 Tax=Ischnura elegans TaxID=197161 RepID=UPI001ED8B104|nr:inositol-trisphosphate 3-kinase homolog [Ischnura elegans]
MDSSVTQFPPTSYSTSYRLRNAWKEVLSQRLNGDQKRSGNDILVELQNCVSSDLLPTGQKCDPNSRTDDESFARDDVEKNVFLQFFALNALDLTAPASDVLLRLACGRRHHPWFQLSGHSGFLAPAGPGTIWKKGGDPSERMVYEKIFGISESGKARRWLWRPEGDLGEENEFEEAEREPARDIVPRFFREVTYKGEKFLELQDLLFGFVDPYVMDVKIGTRTFLEKEASADISSPPRHDLYLKMVKVDPCAPTEEEHQRQMVTKLRYMQFREEQSSSSSLGFRIEAIRLRGLDVIGDLKKLKSREDVGKTLRVFFSPGGELIRNQLLNRLREIRSKFEESPFFKTHEVVGSSVLLLYDENSGNVSGSCSLDGQCNVGAWLIDFAKTRPLPKGVSINHRSPWHFGNHEEGFLFGMDALIEMIGELDLSVPKKDCLAIGSGCGSL